MCFIHSHQQLKDIHYNRKIQSTAGIREKTNPATLRYIYKTKYVVFGGLHLFYLT